MLRGRVSRGQYVPDIKYPFSGPPGIRPVPACRRPARRERPGGHRGQRSASQPPRRPATSRRDRPQLAPRWPAIAPRASAGTSISVRAGRRTRWRTRRRPGRPARPAGAGPVPLDDRIDHPEQQPCGNPRVGIRPDIAIPLSFRDQARDQAVEGPAPRQGRALDLTVAADTQQQGHVRKLRFQHGHRVADEHLQPHDGGRVKLPGALCRLRPPVKRPIQSDTQEFFLAGHVMVNGRLGDAQALGQVLHAGPVVSALVEHLNRDLQQRLQVIPRTPAATGRSAATAVICAARHRAWPRPERSCHRWLRQPTSPPRFATERPLYCNPCRAPGHDRPPGRP